MNKTLLSAALIAGFGVAALAPQAARADGTISITGKVVANTCTFTFGGGASGTNSGTVVLPVVFTTALNAAAATAGKTPFTLTIASCDPNLSSVTETFGGSNIQADGNLKNIAGAVAPQTVAGNVEVQLLSGIGAGTVMNLFSTPTQPAATLVSNGVVLNYQAQYYATAAATAGLVSTTVTYTTSYL